MIRGCPYCRILYPDAHPCPRCGDATRPWPAQLLDREGVRRAVARAAARFEAQPARPTLDALLDLLLVHAPASLNAFDEPPAPTLDALRRADATLRHNLGGDAEGRRHEALPPPAGRIERTMSRKSPFTASTAFRSPWSWRKRLPRGVSTMAATSPWSGSPPAPPSMPMARA